LQRYLHYHSAAFFIQAIKQAKIVNDYIPGQRWISDAELQMGLGTISEIDHRTVTVIFMASGEARTYARQTAPLSRVLFNPGDSIRHQDGWSLTITSIKELDGLLTYIGTREDGQAADLHEGQLDPNTQMNRPAERLFSGQIDPDKWFELRYRTLLHKNRLANSDLRGLTSCRTSLIPHQLYIAHEVAGRYAPRVLLADEVGLGKTIEAGLILHQQLITERAQRVLIVVPETLIHQWLVEMLRRFNLHFSVFDEERCQAMENHGENDIDALLEESIAENPFHSEQLVLCSLEFLSNNSTRFKQAYLGQWDLLVVDEAHHLEWSAEQPSLEYELIELLATETPGVLLLTATPEQLGKESHFARLRLLDPDRFTDFDSFVEEEKTYEPIAHAVEALFNEQPLDEAAHKTLQATLGEADNLALLTTLQDQAGSDDDKAEAREGLIEHLLDRHGTGRVLFRNTRSAVKGFPDRQLHGYPLDMPEEYASCLSAGIDNMQQLLSPELAYAKACGTTPRWIDFDPRVDWLVQQLKTLRPAKVLVITSDADSAMDISETLRVRAGLHAAVFHEHMSIIERDRAAAFFADAEDGTQVLICSEIGSEGRNFQFAHHLVLFDLPFNPDLLEQRIGRLDRIGQRETIQLHVPFIQGSAQETMFHWYHEGLSAFEHTCPTGHSVFVQIQDQLVASLQNAQHNEELITESKRLHDELTEAMHRGRDRLLEYNSCRPHVANDLKQRALKADAASDLLDYLETIFDCFGVDSEVHGKHSYVIRPGEQMQAGSFPTLNDDGMTITWDRETALANEDMHFFSWEHPMLGGAMDMVVGTELGNTAVTAVKYNGVKPGSLLLECIYVLESASSDILQSSRYLPATPIRVVIDQQGRDHTAAVGHEPLNRLRDNVDKKTANKIAKAYAQLLRDMIKNAEAIATQQAPAILDAAHKHIQHTLETEIDRLRALQQVNDAIRAIVTT
jgi:ATP-dependent helicase HepA